MISDDRLRAMRQAPQDDGPIQATDPQKRYIIALIEGREVPKAWLERIKEYESQPHGILKGTASDIIVALKKLPYKQDKRAVAGDRTKNNPSHEDVPAGRYAIQTGDDENDLTFYRVKRPYKNRPEVFFIDIIAGPNSHPQTFGRAQKILKDIYRLGAGDAAILYGQRIGRCSVCHTQITNRVSRELGIGPVCGGRFFPDWKERVNTARTSLIEQGLNPDENVE